MKIGKNENGSLADEIFQIFEISKNQILYFILKILNFLSIIIYIY